MATRQTKRAAARVKAVSVAASPDKYDSTEQKKVELARRKPHLLRTRVMATRETPLSLSVTLEPDYHSAVEGPHAFLETNPCIRDHRPTMQLQFFGREDCELARNTFAPGKTIHVYFEDVGFLPGNQIIEAGIEQGVQETAPLGCSASTRR